MAKMQNEAYPLSKNSKGHYSISVSRCLGLQEGGESLASLRGHAGIDGAEVCDKSHLNKPVEALSSRKQRFLF